MGNRGQRGGNQLRSQGPHYTPAAPATARPSSPDAHYPICYCSSGPLVSSPTPASLRSAVFCEDCSIVGTVHGPWTCADHDTINGRPGQGLGRWYHYWVLFVENATSWPPNHSPLSQLSSSNHNPLHELHKGHSHGAAFCILLWCCSTLDTRANRHSASQ